MSCLVPRPGLRGDDPALGPVSRRQLRASTMPQGPRRTGALRSAAPDLSAVRCPWGAGSPTPGGARGDRSHERLPSLTLSSQHLRPGLQRNSHAQADRPVFCFKRVQSQGWKGSGCPSLQDSHRALTRLLLLAQEPQATARQRAPLRLPAASSRGGWNPEGGDPATSGRGRALGPGRPVALLLFIRLPQASLSTRFFLFSCFWANLVRPGLPRCTSLPRPRTPGRGLGRPRSNGEAVAEIRSPGGTELYFI